MIRKGGVSMFKLWIGNRYYTRGHIVREVKELLYNEGLGGYDDVELINFYSLPCETLKELPSNYEIVDFTSRDILLLCFDNFGVISDREIIDSWADESLR